MYVVSVAPMQLAITVDNTATELYVDGVLTSLSNYNVWSQVDTITIPPNTGVIAVKGTDKGVSYSFILLPAPTISVGVGTIFEFVCSFFVCLFVCQSVCRQHNLTRT